MADASVEPDVTKKTMFFAYPSRPPILRETIVEAANAIEGTGLVNVRTWEQSSGSSHLLIGDITQAIDEADVSACVLTDLNPNVMFEAGYAVGSRKHVWLLLDSSREKTKSGWNQFNLLTPVRYVPYQSASDIRAAFVTELPPEDLKPTIFESVIEPSLEPVAPRRLFFMRSPYEDQASREISRRVDKAGREGWEVALADPAESSYTVTWYARQVYSASVVIIHLVPADVHDADIHNARCSFIGGLAHGMRRPLLILAEEGFETPIDYREVLGRYSTAAHATQIVNTWISEHRTEGPRVSAPAINLGAELRSLRLGEDVAENEAHILSDYFIETASYFDVLEPRTTIFVGRKGTGKTANLLRASEELRDDKRNLVVVIKPSGYEVQGVVRLLSRDLPSDVQSYMVEGLWQYLLETEIALAAVREAEAKPSGISGGTPEWSLRQFIASSRFGMQEEFAVRLERLVDELVGTDVRNESLEDSRADLVGALHANTLGELRSVMRPALADRRRVCVLIDNLDRGWDRASDIHTLSGLFLGLLVAIGRVEADLRRAGIRSQVNLAAFLRTDIFEHVKSVAREPDKLPVSELRWSDSDLLARIVETRYRSARNGSDVGDLWSTFSPTTRDTPTRDYILSRILPRPRDIVHFCNAAIVSAINAGHSLIDEADVLRGEEAYSKFACDAIRVENGITIGNLSEILYRFAGGASRLSNGEVVSNLEEAGISSNEMTSTIKRLRELSFLGIEVGQDSFRYEESAEEATKAEVLSGRFEESAGHAARLEVHPAFRAYLEIPDP